MKNLLPNIILLKKLDIIKIFNENLNDDIKIDLWR